MRFPVPPRFITTMRIKIILTTILLGAAVALPALLLFSRSDAAVAPSVGAYLSGVSPKSDWSVMALAALGADAGNADFLKTVDGQTANDYATYILAITALGEDPRTFGNENLVAGLRSKASAGQLGDAAFVSDDMFGLVALRSAGVDASDSLIAQEVAYVKNKQLADGSWDFSSSRTAGSVDFTAMGIMALLAGGVSASDPAIVRAADYLLDAQNDDGGFPIEPGAASNAESTAWALSAIYAMGEDPLFWAPASDSPADYLEARLHQDGYFLFSASATAADVRTPVTTSYAAIALAGKFYPVSSITAPPSVSLRIEGRESTICDIEAEGRTALDVIKAAAGPCGYAYVIQDTQYGPYLTTIAGEAAAGMEGWSYLPNYVMAEVGAADYAMREGDELIWYYGAWDDKPLRVVHDVSSVALGNSTIAVVQEYASAAWQPFAGATLARGSESFTSNASGQVSLMWSQNGAFYLVAEAAAHVRSNAMLVVAGELTEHASLPLSVTIGAPPASGGSGQNPASGVSFGVSGDLNFGALNPGQSATRQATIANSSASSIMTTASVTGSSLFTDHLTLDNVVPAQWQKSVSANASAPVDVTLSVPGFYAKTGIEAGTLTFWAHPAQ